jgi:hypothetical protein
VARLRVDLEGATWRDDEALKEHREIIRGRKELEPGHQCLEGGLTACG